MGPLMYINRRSETFDKPFRKIIVQSLVLSVANYYIGIWGSTNKTLLQNTQKIQNFTGKVAIGEVSMTMYYQF